MNISKRLSILTFALAAFAATPSEAASGDIVEIRAMDDAANLMYFGSTRNAGNPYLCSADHPLSAGDKLYIRVRMLVRNYDAVRRGLAEPKAWTFRDGALGGSLLNRPKLGLYMGEDRAPAYAELSDFGPQPWQQSGTLVTDDLGNADTDCRYFTDFYFCYTVQAGDLSLPIRLLNGAGTGPADDSDTDAAYYLLNCQAGSQHFVLCDPDGNVANFFYGADALPSGVNWPNGNATTEGPVRNFDLAAEGAFVKTIDFDSGDPSLTGYWREVYEGLGPDTIPSLMVVGGENTAATVVYLWSSDESKVELAASGDNTVITTTDGRHLLRVPVPAGSSSVTFSMKGVAGAAEGDEAEIYMSPVANAVYRPSGDLVGVTVSRKVRIGAPREPTVRIFINAQDKVTDTKVAVPDYETAGGQLILTVTPTCPDPITVRIKAAVSGDSTLNTLADIFDQNVLRIAAGTFTGDPIDQKVTEVTIPANASTLPLNLYLLGATSTTHTKGVTFSLEKVTAPSSVQVPDSNCILKISKTNPPLIVSATPEFTVGETLGTIETGSGATVDFSLEIEDTYKNLNDTDTGYTFKWKVDGDDVNDAPGVTRNEDGRFEASAKFYTVRDGSELTLQVTSPNGTKASVKYWLVVNDGKYTTIARTDERIVFCEGETTWVKLGLTQAYTAGDGFIFLSADDASQLGFIRSDLTSHGATIARGTKPVEAPKEIAFLDGGKDLTLKAVLCSANDLAHPVAEFGCGTITFSVTNRPPQVTSVTAAGQYLDTTMNGKLLTQAISRGVEKTFSVVVDDVDADLNATGADAMKVRWVIDGMSYEVSHDESATFAVKHKFANEKDNALVQVYVKDKDMLAYPLVPNFSFTAKIKDTPRVEIAPSSSMFVEKDKNVSTITVSLTEPASDSITVRFAVSQTSAADGGYLKLRLQEGSVAAATDADGNAIPGAYDLTFGANVQQKILIVSDMDGTIETLAGLDLNAHVTTETLNADGVKWSAFYTKAEPQIIRISNAAPEILRPSDAEAAYTNMNASANTPYAINYACSDVSADLAKGIKAEISVDGVLATTKTVTDSTMQTYSVEFDGEGAHVVEIVFTDKDQESARRTLYYFVKPSKRLELRAHGPANGVAGGHSERYSDAPGLGAGAVFAGSAGPQKVERFVHTYSFGETEKSVKAYARGYKADGSYDNGSLAQSKGIDSAGNWSKGTTIAPDEFYNYSKQNSWGLHGYDSFVYAWVCNNAASSGGESSGGQTETFKLNITDQGETVLSLPDSANQGNNSSSGSTTSYPMQYWEAVFSREYLPTDNAGDINQDGIPDVVVKKFGFGVIDPQSLQISGDDLEDLSAYNEDNDFLPAADNSIYGSLIPGLKDDWSSPFTADLEIRGYGKGLNDALEQLGLGVTSVRIYEDPATCPTSTLSRVEWLAWSEYKAAHPGATEANWSPERPTLPTEEDTDKDGFSDGYEYYYWYLAHVGYIDAYGNHKYLTGRRYDEKNPGLGTLITSETIAEIMDPRVKYTGSDAATRDTDNDGLPDLLEFELGTNPFDFDTDGDGLPDGWEVMIAGLDPLSAQSFADGFSDTTRNNDGDAMAISSYKLEQTELPVPVNYEHAKRWTFAVIDANGDTDGVQWYAMTADPTSKLEVLATFAGGYQVTAVVDGATATFFAETEPTVATEGSVSRLAVDTKVRTLVTWKPDGATEEKALGYPYTLPIGTRVVVTPLAEEVKSYKIATAIDAKDANACWIYGKGAARTQLGEVAETAAEYGCLALARQRAVAAGAEVAALPSDERDVAFLHYLCYQEFGFDPRTAWNPTNPLHKRWGKVTNGESEEGIYVVDRGGYTGAPARTRAYANYDEFLVSAFFVNNTPDGETLSYETSVMSKDAPSLARFWWALTTNPQGPNDAEKTSSEHYYGRSSTNGADTDGDGVPDGWELYVMAGPKKKDGAYVFAPPYAGFTPANATEAMEKSWFSPFIESAKSNDTSNQIYLGGQEMSDGLNEFQEFEGTDTMLYYAKYSDTVKHGDDGWKWLNKFFPTDPWSPDTDGDGVKDADERNAFAYTTATYDDATHGTLRVIPGGGLNPNSVDTDCDGLPDGWEKQFAGKTVYAKDGTTDETKGYVDGMDGTVEDAYTKPGDVNRDYDNDGLENWQEYLTGTMRCWRYDDPLSPLTYLPSDFYYTVDPATTNVVFDAGAAARKFHAAGLLGSDDVNEFWYKTLVDASSAIYNPHLVMDMGSGAQYFSRVTNVWDAAYLDLTLSKEKATGAYYWFYDRIGEHKLKELWGEAWKALAMEDAGAAGVGSVAPTKYASCSPIEPDTDKDGMDDYYEVFHGMNPLLGSSGIERDAGAHDVIYDSLYADNKVVPEAWGTGDSASSFKNYWQRKVALPSWTGKKPRGNEFDFEVFPWLNGLAGADPDGDGLINQEEAIMPLVNTPAHHTDPTPLWMTDTSYSNSLVRMNYRLPYRAGVIPLTGDGFTYEEKTYRFSDFDGFATVAKTGETVFGPFNPDAWKLVGTRNALGWIASFEQNEGFDSDHDGLNDQDELKGKFRSASDPLDVDSPQRRQAMYFQGPSRPSILQTLPFTKEYHPMAYRAGRYPDDLSFLQYTVECWVKAESLADATVIERAVLVGLSSPDDREYVRCNFRLGLKGGKWYTGFDPNNTTAESVSVFSTTAATAEWTHLAATYDGTTLTLYVNGRASSAVRCGLQPTYGASDIATIGPGGAFNGGRSYAYHAIVLGASVKTNADGHYGRALDVTLGSGWNAYKDFFTGYVDEVRIWDGARTATEIADAKMKRFTSEDAKANRETFFSEWSKGGENDLYRGRYAKDGSGNPYSLPAELRFHWAFDSLFGAGSEAAVATAPAGFNYEGANAAGDGGRACRSRPEGYGIAWWQNVLDGYTGTVYNDPAWICWVPNTVAHLPRFDGTTLDSRYWSEDFEGQKGGIYKFARTAEPGSVWTQCLRGDVKVGAGEYFATGSRHHLVEAMDAASGSSLATLFEFTGRHLNQTGDDLLALGGAYAKHIDNLWDSQGASSNWEITFDTDVYGHGLPDWWLEYANGHYRIVGSDSSIKDWDTLVWWPEQGGTQMKAGEAYLRDLARGYHPGANGVIVKDDSDGDFTQRYDLDGNGIPDWWEEIYGIKGESAFADHDNDGLCNLVEYMLSEKFEIKDALGKRKLFDPAKFDSATPGVPDCFFRIGSLYVGEVFADHDFIEDWWERQYANDYVSTLVYDTKTDNDDDGWSAFAEARYSQQVSPIVADGKAHYDTVSGLVADFPIPTVQLKVTYNGSRAAEVDGSSMSVRIGRDLSASHSCDASYWIKGAGDTSSNQAATSNVYRRLIGKWSDRRVYGTLTPGRIKANEISIQVAYDPSSVIYSWSYRTPSSSAYSEGDGFLWEWRYARGTYAEYSAAQTKYGVDNVNLLSTSDSFLTLKGLEVRSDLNSEVATLRWATRKVDLGTVNLRTGEYDLDLGVFANGYVQEEGDTNGTTTVSLEDQTYRIVYAANPSTGLPRDLYLGETASAGHIREGKNQIMVWADLDGDNEYDVGEPFGYVRDVDIGWRKRAVEVEIFDQSPILPRIDMLAAASGESGESSGVAADRGKTVTAYCEDLIRIIREAKITEAERDYALEKLKWTAANVWTGASLDVNDLEQVRVRIVRWALDGQPVYRLGIEPETVLDQKMRLSNRAFLTEADILATGALDLDWDKLKSDVVDNFDVQNFGAPVTNMAYLVVIGDGKTAWDTETETNSAPVILNHVIERRYGFSQAVAEVYAPKSEGSIVYASQPTFKWTVPGEVDSDYTGYTAFRLQILPATGDTPVWDSGVRRLPPRDSYGRYVWTAPAYLGNDLEKSVNYRWRVAVLNAKYPTPDWSKAGVGYFRMEPNAPGSDSGTIHLAVRYFGPANELLKAGVTGTVRVEAFTSPDFTGDPAARAAVPASAWAAMATTDSVESPACEVELTGLPNGTYYVRAYIDSLSYGTPNVHDDWEPWGYLCGRVGRTEANAAIFSPTAVTVNGATVADKAHLIYLEDADVNGNRIPDIYEICTNGGSLDNGTINLDKTLNCGLAVKDSLITNMTELAGLDDYTGLISHYANLLRTRGLVSLALGVPASAVSVDASGRIQVINRVESVKIESMSLEGNRIDLKVTSSAAAATGVDAAAASLYGATVSASAKTVTCKVFRTETLSPADWQEVAKRTVSVGTATVSVDLPESAGTAGFYRVVIEE